MSAQPCGCDDKAMYNPGTDTYTGYTCKLHLGSPFKIKDSGERAQFDSGMVRDVATDKVDYSLVMDGPMFQRWATHLTNGAKKYSKRNWMKAAGQEELDRFRESALRHFIQWYYGESDEDHASAVIFNMNGAEYVKAQPLKQTSRYPTNMVTTFDGGICTGCGSTECFVSAPGGGLVCKNTGRRVED